MKSLAIVIIVLLGALPHEARTGEPAKGTAVYGQWQINVRPDKTAEYGRLIGTKGLPLFREAGGQMVGWWTTLVGDVFQHVTIWRFDDMAAFERSIEKLGKEPRFAEFVAQRDPLLASEQSSLLRLADGAREPALPENAKIVVHEVHRVPLPRRTAYLAFMQSEGSSLLARHGFRPFGPLVADVGDWCEVTWLFRFDSLHERGELIAKFAAAPDARTYGGKIQEFAEGVTTRVLVPAPFAHAPAK